MKLEFYEDSEGRSFGFVPVNKATDAEDWVRETSSEELYKDTRRWVLFDDIGKICIWQRPGEGQLPEVIQRSPRYDGQWEKGPNEVPITDGVN